MSNKTKSSLDTRQVDLPCYKTHYNIHLWPDWAEENNGVSQTVPDMSYTVDEIVARHARGITNLNVQTKVEIYEGDEDFFPDLRAMDISERHEYLQQRAEEYKELESKAKEAKKRADNANRKKIEELEGKIAELSKAHQGGVVQRTSGGAAE